MSTKGGGRPRGGGGGDTSAGSVRSAALGPCENTGVGRGRGGGGGGGVGPLRAGSAPIMNTGGGATQPSAASGPRIIIAPEYPANADGVAPGGGGTILPEGHPEPEAKENSVPPLAIPTALFLRPYKPRKITASRFRPLELEDPIVEVAKPDPMEYNMLRHEISALQSPLLQAIVDSATFYSEGISLKEYFTDAVKKIEGQDGNRLLSTVYLPKTKAARVKMTDEAAAVLCSWVCLFTRNHVANRSWNGEFDLNSFILLHGQVHAIKPPKLRLATHSERLKDFQELTKLILLIFILDGKRPPYLAHLIKKLKELPPGPLLESYRLALETHFCFLTSMGGTNLLYQLKIKFDGLVGTEKGKFMTVLDLCKLPKGWLRTLEANDLFKQIIEWGLESEKMISCKETSTSAFILTRNYTTHVSKNSVADDGKTKLFNVDGALLMVPELLDDFAADVMFNLLHNDRHKILGVEEIAKNCMPSPTQVLYKRVENSESSFMKALVGDGNIQQEKDGVLKETEQKVTLPNNDSQKSKNGGSNGGNGKLENAMTYEDLLRRNKQLERGAQISVLLSKHMRDLCAQVGCEVPKEVIEIERLKDEMSVGSSEETKSPHAQNPAASKPTGSKDM